MCIYQILAVKYPNNSAMIKTANEDPASSLLVKEGYAFIGIKYSCV